MGPLGNNLKRGVVLSWLCSLRLLQRNLYSVASLVSTRLAEMANEPVKPMNKRKASFPPKRGQIKVRIIGNLIKTIIVAAKAGGRRGRSRRQDGRDGDGSTSVSTTPPQSAYTSETDV
uniref:Uncharacterized protein n=1 Tax=Nelumbo nucifera TaxID=4432 RepID=A0A822Y8W6_NELNU|nr:TPA_asm: hypothetical protein HUJ06_027506 [Nelumbo nucifera]